MKLKRSNKLTPECLTIVYTIEINDTKLISKMRERKKEYELNEKESIYSLICFLTLDKEYVC